VVGQAAVFNDYKLEDGTIIKFGKGGQAVPLPTTEDLLNATIAIDEQGKAVKRLKEEEGKGNSDPDVKVGFSIIKELAK
jgi:hypothetical protein